MLATADGLVKKTALTEYDTNRSGGIIAINLREDDELVSAMLADEDDDILLVSRKGMSLRFTADDSALRPMGRATSGVKGMSFRAGDRLLSADVLPADRGSSAAEGGGDRGSSAAEGGVSRPADPFVFTVTDGGFAKRSAIAEYRPQGRGGLGIKVAKLSDERGVLAGAIIVAEDDEVLVVLASGKVVRSSVSEVRPTGRDSMGVVFARFDDEDRILAIARNSERHLDDGQDTGKDEPEA